MKGFSFAQCRVSGIASLRLLATLLDFADQNGPPSMTTCGVSARRFCLRSKRRPFVTYADRRGW